MTPGYFVTGTDTHVGKTLMACGLTRLWHRAGHRVGVMKPLATGDRRDARALKAAAQSPETIETINPQFFRAPMAPHASAWLEKKSVRWPLIDRTFRALQKKSDRMIIEGVGGLLVPLDARLDGADLIRRFGYPAILVARAALGTLNHTLLTLEAMRRRRLSVAGILLSGGTGRSSLEKWNRRILRERAGVPVLGQVVFKPCYRLDIDALASDLKDLAPIRALLGL